jgi:hypothetical protein
MAAGVSKMRRSLRAGRFGRRSEGFVAKDREEVEWHRLTRLVKFELGLSAAGLNPSGASNLGLKQRTERSNERAGG